MEWLYVLNFIIDIFCNFLYGVIKCYDVLYFYVIVRKFYVGDCVCNS